MTVFKLVEHETKDPSFLKRQEFNRYSPQDPKFSVFHDRGKHLLGSNPSITLALESDKGTFHEACVFVPGDLEDSVFVTSNAVPDESSGPQNIEISKLTRSRSDWASWSRKTIPTGDAVMANGGVNDVNRNGVLFCVQGDQYTPSSLVCMDSQPPYGTRFILTNFYGRRFNSTNDVVFARDGAIWFTDPTYGFEQGFRPEPQLPSQVYRYDEQNGSLRAMADGFGKPNGLCFSPEENIMYVTDTDWLRGDGVKQDTKASHIYAFDVTYYHSSPFLTNKRLFAMADCGIPDGIKCDTEGNVYSGCGDGVNIWGPDGYLLAKIVFPDLVANFCFGRAGELFVLNEKRFWVVQIAETIHGALLRI